jgi:hypothetical protein
MRRVSVSGDKQGRGKEPAVALKRGLEKRLFAYALVAGAGLTLTSAAKAEIVYTQAYHACGYVTPIDLNHDGITDFWLNTNFFSGWGFWWVSEAAPSDRIIATAYRTLRGGLGHFAAALKSGVSIGQDAKFLAGIDSLAWKNSSGQYGPWAYKIDRYLGLEFQLDGKAHFGWARLTVWPNGMALTGYAYETTPGKSILAGQTQSGNDVGMLVPQVAMHEGSATFHPATLSLLKVHQG